MGLEARTVILPDLIVGLLSDFEKDPRVEIFSDEYLHPKFFDLPSTAHLKVKNEGMTNDIYVISNATFNKDNQDVFDNLVIYDFNKFEPHLFVAGQRDNTMDLVKLLDDLPDLGVPTSFRDILVMRFGFRAYEALREIAIYAQRGYSLDCRADPELLLDFLADKNIVDSIVSKNLSKLEKAIEQFNLSHISSIHILPRYYYIRDLQQVNKGKKPDEWDKTKYKIMSKYCCGIKSNIKRYRTDIELLRIYDEIISAFNEDAINEKTQYDMETLLNLFFNSWFADKEIPQIKRLIKEGKCKDEEEIVECAKIDLDNKEYTILGKLGHGGSGDVYLAKDTLLNRDVALKIFRTEELSKEIDSQRKRRGEEPVINCLKILLDFEHKNLSKHYGHFRLGNDIVLVKEYIDGKNLHDWLGKLDPNDIRCVFNYMLNVTDHLHKKNFILRDIKLENVLLSQDKKTVKIDDLETALLEEELRRRVEDAKEAKEESKQDDIRYKLTKGSELYAAPEIAGKENRNPNFSFLTDIYALGACLLYMLRKDDGRQPGHRSLKEINILDAKTYNKKLEEVLEGLSYRYSLALKKALAYKPEDRFKDIEEFRRELIPKVPTITEEEIGQFLETGVQAGCIKFGFRCYNELDHYGRKILTDEYVCHEYLSYETLEDILGYEDEEGIHPLFFITAGDRRRRGKDAICVTSDYGQLVEICTEDDETLWSRNFKIDPYEVAESVINYIKTKSPEIDEETLSFFKDFFTGPYLLHLDNSSLDLMHKYLVDLLDTPELP